MLLQKQIQRDGEAPLRKPAGAVMTRRAAVGEQPGRRFALVQILGPRRRVRDQKKDANEEQSEHHCAKPGLPADQLHTLNSLLSWLRNARGGASPQSSGHVGARALAVGGGKRVEIDELRIVSLEIGPQRLAAVNLHQRLHAPRIRIIDVLMA